MISSFILVLFSLVTKYQVNLSIKCRIHFSYIHVPLNPDIQCKETCFHEPNLQLVEDEVFKTSSKLNNHQKQLGTDPESSYHERLPQTKDFNVTFRAWTNCLYSLSYLPNPSARAGYDTRQIFKRSLTGLNSEFSFS